MLQSSHGVDQRQEGLVCITLHRNDAEQLLSNLGKLVLKQ